MQFASSGTLEDVQAFVATVIARGGGHILTREKCPPDWDRAYLEKVQLDSVDYSAYAQVSVAPAGDPS